ncbi:MAG: M48 family metalloprotease [Candidatus Omnitrophica bacterium]|nr:M48 family metalloprotease [Candidatus Omnitrophota bacterium]
MALTYTEIEQQKNSRIWIFFTIVLLFYFLIAAVLANAAKLFFLAQAGMIKGKASLFLSSRQMLNVFLIVLAMAILHTLFSALNASSFIKGNLRAQNIDTSDKYHKRFNNIVSDVNVATGSKYNITSVVIPTVAMNAFAVSDWNKNAIVGVTEGLLSKLNRQQLQAVVAHEVGHIVSGDSFQTTIGCSLFGIYAAMLTGIKRVFEGGRVRVSGRGSGGAIIFLLLIFILLSIMQFFYSLVRMFLSRNRELRADAIAVRLTRDPVSLSEALYAISRGWRGLGYIDKNLESLFIINPANSAVDEKEGFWSNLLSTHPPIKKRIKILADMAHAHVKNIEEKVVSQEKIKESMREIPAEKKELRWMIAGEEKQWSGPFNIVQMMALGWMRPDTWIKAIDGEVMQQAKEEPLLKPFFEGKVKGLKVSSLDCPGCAQALIDEEYEGTMVKRCVFCGGVLVEKGKMPRIIVRREKGFGGRVEKLAEMAQRNGLDKMRSKVKDKRESLLKCPKCEAAMVRNFYTMAYLIEVDRCSFCNHVWFDKDELEMVQYLIENKKSGHFL